MNGKLFKFAMFLCIIFVMITSSNGCGSSPPSPTIQPPTTMSTPKPPPFVCTEEGKFPDPDDCSSYYICYIDFDGQFVKERMSCCQFPFNIQENSCDHIAVSDCNPIIRQPISEGPYKCDNTKFSSCADCKTRVKCLELYDQQIIQKCGAGHYCSEDMYSNTAECKPNYEVQNCDCGARDLIQYDPYSEVAYARCLVGNDRYINYCKKGMTFNKYSNECTY